MCADTTAPSTEALFEDAPCGLLVTAESGQILRANRTLCQWLGMTGEALCTRRFQDLLTTGGKIFHQTHLAPLLRMQGSVAEVKLDLTHQDGQLITLLVNGVRRERQGGVCVEMAFFATADRDKYERELLQARKTAEQLLTEKTATEQALRTAQDDLTQAYAKAQRRATFAEQMVAIVSHDLKNPLTAISMATQFLSRAQRTPQETRLLGGIERSAERATRMVSDLLDLAVARVGRGITVVPAPVDPHALVAHCVDELRVAFTQAPLLHVCEGSGMACLDADRVSQIIGNLIANSVAYGDCSQPITLTSRVDAAQVVITVHNFGPVIAEHLIADLFEPMTRGTQIHDDLRSVGLGLFIVREIATAHGGSVSVCSQAGAGTTFTLSFPQSATDISPALPANPD